MSGSQKTINLPIPTNATKQGPVIESQGDAVRVRYDQEDGRGSIRWTSLDFKDVLAYEVHQSVCCAAEDVLASKVMSVLDESPWLLQVVGCWAKAVGWQADQERLGGAKRFKHHKVYFDDACSIHVIAASCTIEDTQAASN